MSIFKKETQRNPNASFYVGNLDPLVDEPLLYELFTQFGPVSSLNLPKDRVSRQHQGYGFVEFKTVADATYALEILRGIRLYGRTLKMKRTDSNTNSSSSNNTERNVSVGARLFIKNLSPLVDEEYLKNTFSEFGRLIEKPWIARNEDGSSKGHGIIEYGDFDDSDSAIKNMNGAILMNNQISVEYAYKDGTSKGLRHGDSVERLLAEKAKAASK